MAKATKATTPITMDFEAVEDRAIALHDYTVNFVTVKHDQDLGPMLAVLPEGRCHCPHWGVMTKGRMTVWYADREETFVAGDAFYMPPGHVPKADAGTEFVMFSPSDLLADTDAAIAKGLEEAEAAG
jgi:mannose-6-phosphate isomerase-like protein (cupin superfamily)